MIVPEQLQKQWLLSGYPLHPEGNRQCQLLLRYSEEKNVQK